MEWRAAVLMEIGQFGHVIDEPCNTNDIDGEYDIVEVLLPFTFGEEGASVLL